MKKVTIDSALYQTIVQPLFKNGLTIHEFENKTGICFNKLHQADQRITVKDSKILDNLIEKYSYNPAFALHLAVNGQFEYMGIVGYIIKNID